MAKTVRITDATWRKLERLIKEQDAGRTHKDPKSMGTTLVRVRNDSGVNVPRFGVLGIEDAVFDPMFHLGAFQQDVVLSGVKPSQTKHHDGRFVICAEPLAVGQIGKAYAAGVCPVHIAVNNAGHLYADITEGNVLGLGSTQNGPCVILWKESGTGARWAVVRFQTTLADAECDVQWVELYDVTGNTIRGFYRQYVPFGPMTHRWHWDVDYWGQSGFKEPWNVIHGKPLVWENESPPFWMNRPYYHNNGSDWCLYWQCNNGFTTDEPSLSSQDWSPFTVTVRPYPMRHRKIFVYEDYEVGQVIPVTRVWSPALNQWLVVAMDDVVEDKTLSLYVLGWPDPNAGGIHPGYIWCSKNWKAAGAPAWSSSTTYHKGDIVWHGTDSFGSRLYWRSLRYDNVGIAPNSYLASNGHYWTRVIIEMVHYHAIGGYKGDIWPNLPAGEMLTGRRRSDDHAIWTDKMFFNAALLDQE